MKRMKKKSPTGTGRAKDIHKDTVTKHIQYSRSPNPSKVKDWVVPHLAAARFDGATSSNAQFAQKIWSIHWEDMKWI